MMPLTTFSNTDHCAICMDDFTSIEKESITSQSRTSGTIHWEIIKVLTCKHTFHATCIQEWLLDHNTCPICRVDLNRATPLDQENRERTSSSQQRQTRHSPLQSLHYLSTGSVPYILTGMAYGFYEISLLLFRTLNHENEAESLITDTTNTGFRLLVAATALTIAGALLAYPTDIYHFLRAQNR